MKLIQENVQKQLRRWHNLLSKILYTLRQKLDWLNIMDIIFVIENIYITTVR